MVNNPLAAMIDPKHTALLVIDVQNDFFHSDGALGRREGDIFPIQRAVPPLVRFLAEARQVGLPILFVRHINTEWSEPSSWALELRAACGVERRVVCREGSWGAEYYQVEPRPGELQIAKRRYNAFLYTDLDLILRGRGIKTLILTGGLTDVCVETTAWDAYMRDYHIIVLEDCCGTITQERHEATLTRMGRLGLVAPSPHIVEAWTSARLTSAG